MEDTTESNIHQYNFSVQEPYDNVSCSAHAAINTLVLSDISIPLDEKKALIEYSHRNKQLDVAEKEALFAMHGLEFHSLSMELLDVKRTPEYISEVIINTVKEHPIAVSISTLLSKKPEEYRQFKSIFHVVSVAYKDRKLEVIDPYDPYDPEVFDTTDPAERQRFLAWFTSGRAQQVMMAQGKEATPQNVIRTALDKLQSPNKEDWFMFIGESLSQGLAYYGVKKD